MKKEYTKLMNHDDVEAVLDKAKGFQMQDAEESDYVPF